MKWHKKIYFGEEAEKKKNTLIKKIEHREICFGVYLISLSACQHDLFDIIPSFMLFGDNNFEREYIGVALTKEEAFDVVRKIIDDVYNETGSFDVRSYFK